MYIIIVITYPTKDTDCGVDRLVQKLPLPVPHKDTDCGVDRLVQKLPLPVPQLLSVACSS